jgi:hypothetical protein
MASSKAEELQQDPDECPPTQLVQASYPDSVDSPIGFNSLISTFQEPPKKEEVKNPFLSWTEDLFLKFGVRISLDLDSHPLILSRLMKTCKMLNDKLRSCLTAWKVRALSDIIVENGNFLLYLLKNKSEGPIRIIKLGTAFFGKYNRKFWDNNLDDWIREHKEAFLFGPDKGMFQISIEGEF